MIKLFAAATAALSLTVGAAQAGSVQRDTDRSQILFEKGKNFLEFSVTHVSPEVSGVTATPGFPIPGLRSGNIAESYQFFSLGYKGEINDRLSFAITGHNPVGADVQYSPAIYPFTGSNAEVQSYALTGYLKYNLSDRISVYGGLRAQILDGNVNLFSILGAYTLAVDSDLGFGYVVGGAYEIPEMALRLAMTYESEIEHSFRDNTGAPFKVKVPQAVTLHARTGINPKTLVFGSARWQEWSKFRIAPPDFLANPANPAGLPIAFGSGDYWTYELGVGRRFTDRWSGAATIGYEPSVGRPVGNLEGRDGFTSYGLGVKYSTESYDVTFGVKYIELGSATTTTIGSRFSGNDAVAMQLRLGYRW